MLNETTLSVDKNQLQILGQQVFYSSLKLENFYKTVNFVLFVDVFSPKLSHPCNNNIINQRIPFLFINNITI